MKERKKNRKWVKVLELFVFAIAFVVFFISRYCTDRAE